MMYKTNPLEKAKNRLSFQEVWRELGISGEPKSLMSSPFREDKNPSFSCFQNKDRTDLIFKDHATGETGDKIALIQKAKNCSRSEASKELIKIARARRVIS